MVGTFVTLPFVGCDREGLTSFARSAAGFAAPFTAAELCLGGACLGGAFLGGAFLTGLLADCLALACCLAPA